jgi:peptidoglycan/xylan/chitin deacetylase (PgdA/CDA1 family)
MRALNDQVIRAGLDALYYSGVYRLMAPAASGCGLIFALHRVCPEPPRDAFAPNRGLEVSAGFLDQVLRELRHRAIDIVDLDTAVQRLRQGTERHFAVFTFDDGYADSIRDALPVFERYDAPFTVFVTTGLIDGSADVWWLVMEEIIRRLDHIATVLGGEAVSLPARSAEEKSAAWDALYWRVRDLPIAERRSVLAPLAQQAGVNDVALCKSVAATWDELRAAARHPLVTLGAHTVHHFALSQLSESDARYEMAEGKRRLEAEIGQTVRHFAYPFGDRTSAGLREFRLAREVGFDSAVTTRRGPLFPAHVDHLQALPRVSLNGNYQVMRYVDLFVSGAPFVLWNRARRLDVA